MPLDQRACDRAPRSRNPPRARRRAGAGPECHRFELAYRAPYDWDAILAFLRSRATPGVESVEDGRYRRTISVDGQTGLIDASHLASRSAISLEVCFPDSRALVFIVERVRRIFDVGADPDLIGTHLRTDPLLRRPLAKHPGIRTPGAWDGFELVVRAILGQQISVGAATTLAGRLAAMFGSPAASDRDLDRLFPTAAQLADAAIERAGIMPARARTIRAVARGVTDGTIVLSAGADGRAAISALRTVPGIGDWTAEYVAMRAFNESDAFLRGDRVLGRVAGDCTASELEERSQAWRPWRAYAVMLLWQMASEDPGR